MKHLMDFVEIHYGKLSPEAVWYFQFSPIWMYNKA
jgi:hypothetical protein